jgi:hypothetical protein
MSKKFTPGPWRVKNERWIVATRGEYEGEILIAPAFWLTHVPEEQAANARLIASAPLLLEALEGMCTLFVVVCDLKGWTAKEYPEYAKARAAILAATGGGE